MTIGFRIKILTSNSRKLEIIREWNMILMHGLILFGTDITVLNCLGRVPSIYGQVKY